jgi:hypothetical protein
VCVCGADRGNEDEDACSPRVSDAANGPDAGPVVVAAEVAVLHVMVVANVSLHLLTGDKLVLSSLFFSRPRWARRVCAEGKYPDYWKRGVNFILHSLWVQAGFTMHHVERINFH